MAELKLLEGNTMARAVEFDPQFQMPAQPRFPHELVVVPLEDGLLVEGTDVRQVLRGKATKNLLPHLLPLLDGTRTIGELKQALPHVPLTHISSAVALLYTRGLLEDSVADPELDPDTLDAPTLGFLRRHIDSTRVNRSGLEAAARLAMSQVLIYCSGPQRGENGQLLARLLQQAGVGKVECIEPDTELKVNFDNSVKGAKLVVVFTAEPVSQNLERDLVYLDDECARLKIPWLRAALNSGQMTADLGPYFERDETTCYRCFARGQVSQPEPPIEDEAGRATVAGKLEGRLWANMLAMEVIYLLSRTVPLATGQVVTRYDLKDWSSARLYFPKLPGCVYCYPLQSQPGAVQAKADGLVDTALLYENSVLFPSRHLIDPKAHQAHYRVTNHELSFEGKEYPSIKKISLPQPEPLEPLIGSTLAHLPSGTGNRANLTQLATEALDLSRLATLLRLSAGIRTVTTDTVKRVRRWTPTGGNLGSPEIYVVAYKVAGLEPGIYFYQPNEHLLACIGEVGHPEVVKAFMAKVTPDTIETLPDAMLLLVGANQRVARKYSAFAYRVINLDAGVALSQLHMIGSSLGLKTRTVPRWADDLIADKLDLEAIAEIVTGVLAVKGL